MLDLGRLLAAEGESVTVIGPGAEAVSDGPFDVAAVGRVRTIRANGSVVPLAVGRDLASQIRRAAAVLDVLHVHEPLMPMVGPAALRAGRPVVATFHALAPPWVSFLYRAAPLKWRNRRLLGNAVVTAVSTEAASGPAPLGPVAIIPNGIDLAFYEPAPSKIPGRVVFLGRADARKGLPVLQAAWPMIGATHPQASLIVIGIAGDGAEEGIDFRGRVSDSEKRRMLGEASIMAAPNLGGESFGLVVVEAMSAGCAVVASDIPAFRAVLAGAGELVPPGDASALAGAISGLLSDPAAITALGVAGRRRARDFDWSRVLPLYQACYQKAIDL